MKWTGGGTNKSKNNGIRQRKGVSIRTKERKEKDKEEKRRKQESSGTLNNSGGISRDVNCMPLPICHTKYTNFGNI